MSSLSEHSQLLDPMLAKLFMAHGIKAIIDGEWLTFPKHSDMKLQGILLPNGPEQSEQMAQVAILFSPWIGTVIGEMFVGIGGSLQQRIDDAIGIFAQNVFHVLLKVFFNQDCHQQVDQFQIVNDQSTRMVTNGNFCIRGEGTEGLAELLPQIAQLLGSQFIPSGTNWGRLLYSQIDGQQSGIELLLNNELWTDALPIA